MSGDTAELAWLSAQVPAPLKAELEAIAARDDRSLSWVIRQALKIHVANFGERSAA